MGEDDFSWLMDQLGGGDSGGVPQQSGVTGWTGGFDLAGGGDTGLPTLPGSSFSVGPGQNPSQIYEALIRSGLLTPGANVPQLTGYGITTPPGGGGGVWSNFLRSLGLTNSAGDPNGLNILAALAPLLGGLYAANRTGKATDQVVGGINNASETIKQILGGATSPFTPYTTAGAAAVGKAGAMNWQPLAPRFAPLGQPQGGATSLAALMRGR